MMIGQVQNLSSYKSNSEQKVNFKGKTEQQFFNFICKKHLEQAVTKLIYKDKLEQYGAILDKVKVNAFEDLKETLKKLYNFIVDENNPNLLKFKNSEGEEISILRKESGDLEYKDQTQTLNFGTNK